MIHGLQWDACAVIRPKYALNHPKIENMGGRYFHPNGLFLFNTPL